MNRNQSLRHITVQQVLTKKQIAQHYQVDLRTITRKLEKSGNSRERFPGWYAANRILFPAEYQPILDYLDGTSQKE